MVQSDLSQSMKELVVVDWSIGRLEKKAGFAVFRVKMLLAGNGLCQRLYLDVADQE